MSSQPQLPTCYVYQQSNTQQEWPFSLTDEQVGGLVEELNVNALISVLANIQSHQHRTIVAVHEVGAS